MITRNLIAVLLLALFSPFNGMGQVSFDITPQGGFEPFHALEVEGLLHVKIEQGSRAILYVTTHDTLNPGINASVKNGVLTLKSTKGAGSVHLIHTGIDLIKLTAAVELDGVNVMVAPSLKLQITGACQADLTLETEYLDISITGASQVDLKGTARETKVVVTGASQYQAAGLETNNTLITLSGASQAEINASDTLIGKVSGMSSISFAKEPAYVEIDKTGSSEVVLGGLDTLKVKIGKQKIIIIEDLDDIEEKTDTVKKPTKNKFNGHWGGVELMLNSYMSVNNRIEVEDPYGFLDPDLTHSIGLNFNLIEKSFPIVKDHLGIVSGLGWTYNNYRFDPDIKLRNDTSIIWADESTLYDKSKLRVNSITLPVILEFQTNAKSKTNSFHLGAGMIFGLNVGARTKNLYFSDDERIKVKQRGEFHLNPLSAAATARLGWGKLNLFASYNLLPMFKAGEGPELYPVQVGITLVDW